VNKKELFEREAQLRKGTDGKEIKPDYSAHKDTLKADGTPLHAHPQRAGVFERDKSGKLVAEIREDGKRVLVDENGWPNVAHDVVSPGMPAPAKADAAPTTQTLGTPASTALPGAAP
jgi:hypothetical protein